MTGRQSPPSISSSLTRRFRSDRRGGFSVMMCVGLMGLALIVCGGVEMADLFSERSKLRSVADSAALWGASSIALTGEDGVEERSRAFAMAQLEKMNLRVTPTALAEIVDLGGTPNDPKKGLKVTIRGQRESFFGSMFPPGGFKIAVASTALSVGKVPLCILGTGADDTDSDGGDTVKVKDTGNILATGCLVHSNDNIRVEASGRIDAGLTQAVNRATGSINPDANTGAEKIDDPFTKLDLTPKGSCLATLPLIHSLGVISLPAGVHCRDVRVEKYGEMRLAAGKHYFKNAKLEVKENARLTADAGAVLIFDKDSKFEFKDHSSISLTGMKTGDLAGFLMVAARDNKHDFIITSDNVESLLGTIYVPNAKLIIEGKDDVAKESAWTVIVADRVELKGDPTLVMNTDYHIGGVPVPSGVGSNTLETRIVK